MARSLGSDRPWPDRPGLRRSPPECRDGLDDADHGGRHRSLRRRRGNCSARSEPPLSALRGLCHSVDHPLAGPVSGLQHRSLQEPALPVCVLDAGAELMAAPTYSLGKTLLKIDNVSLEYDGRPVLSGVTAGVRDILVPG